MSIKIAIGIPCNRQIKPKTVECLLDLVAHSKDVEFEFIIATEGYTISENRTYCAAMAKKQMCDYLLFIDDDMTFPPDTLESLYFHQKDIIGTVAHSRCISEDTHVMLKSGEVLQKKDRPDKVFQVKAIGTAVLLIKMSVFDEVDMPYFNTETHENGFTTLGEDYWFCRQAERKGIKIWCDPTIQIGHLGDYEY